MSQGQTVKELLELHRLTSGKIEAYVRIGRPADAVRPVLFLFLGAAIATGELTGGRPLWMGALSLVALSIAVVIFNDIQDLEIDRISNPHRPLPSGNLGILEAGMLGVAYLVISLVAITAVGVLGFTYWVALFLIGFLYSAPKIRLSHNLFTAPLCLVAANIVIPLLMGYGIAIDSFLLPREPVQYVIWFSVIVLPIGALKDLKDTAGDAADRKTTLLKYVSPRRLTGCVALVSTLVIFAFEIWRYGIGAFSGPEAVAAILLVALLTLNYVLMSRKSHNERVSRLVFLSIDRKSVV